jgi:hypothetical protein
VTLHGFGLYVEPYPSHFTGIALRDAGGAALRAAST